MPFSSIAVTSLYDSAIVVYLQFKLSIKAKVKLLSEISQMKRRRIKCVNIDDGDIL